MRGLFTFILFFLLFLIFPLAIFSYAINSILSPEYIKGKLVESKIYKTSAESIPQLIKLPDDVQSEMTDQTEADFNEFLKKEVTADYLQKKTESLVDSSFDWLSGKTESTPTLNLSDLNGKLSTFAKEKGSPLPEDFIEPAPMKFEPTKDNLKIRQIFQIIQAVPIFFATASGVMLLLIFLLAKGWKSKLRKLSLALFVPGVFGLLATFATNVIVKGTLNYSINTVFIKEPSKYLGEPIFSGELEALAEPVKKLLLPILDDITRLMIIIFGAFLVVVIVFFLISFFVGNKPKVAPQALQSGIK